MDPIPISELSILIVEASMTSARFIEDQLKSLEVRNVEYRESGAEALGLMRNQPPDVVVSSMYLPDMTAIELVETMRSDPQLDAIPFMLVSTETSFAMLEPIRQAGIIAILPKPFSTDDLRRALIGSTKFLSINRGDEATGLEDLRVLVVDDSLLARKFIVRILNSLGIEDITEAENGSEAVHIIDRSYFDLVITDYNMPEMDGEKLIRYIREDSLQRSIPILMVTSEHNGSRLAAVQHAGVSGICDKPFEADVVLKMIQDIRVA